MKKLEVDIGVFGTTERKRDKKVLRHYALDGRPGYRCYTSIGFPKGKMMIRETCEGRNKHKGPHFTTYSEEGVYVHYLWPTGVVEQPRSLMFGLDEEGGRW